MLRALMITLAFSAAASTIALSTVARADVAEVVADRILPGYAAFAATTQSLADAATTTCDPATLRPAFQSSFDAWMAVQHLRLGPIEEDGRGLAIAFWPDPKGLGAKAQRQLLAGDPAALAPEAFAQQSVAARGLMGLERLLYPDDATLPDTCPLIRATALDLARMAAAVNAGWTGGYAETLRTAGDAGNTTFLTRPEARQALFTQIVSGLEFTLDLRLGRPLGSFEKPQPDRAEARASGRSLRNVQLSLAALRAMVASLTPDVPQTMAAFDRAITQAAALDDPVFAGAADPQKRLKIEILQQSLISLRGVALAELARELDVGIGFNAADGD